MDQTEKTNHLHSIKSGDEFVDMCTFIGAITLDWAWVENTLAMTISIIKDKYGDIEGHSEDPVSLTRKAKCLRAALKTINQLATLKETGNLLSERLVKLSNRRNDFVHGAMRKTHKGTIQAFSLKVVKGEYSAHEQSITIDDAAILKSKISDLSNDMVAFMHAIDTL